MLLEDTFDIPMKQEFALTNVYSKEDCKDCWAKFYCSGGCAANSWQYEGNILKSHKLSVWFREKTIGMCHYDESCYGINKYLIEKAV